MRRKGGELFKKDTRSSAVCTGSRGRGAADQRDGVRGDVAACGCVWLLSVWLLSAYRLRRDVLELEPAL